MGRALENARRTMIGYGRGRAPRRSWRRRSRAPTRVPPAVYGYVLGRGRDCAVAEDLTAEAFVERCGRSAVGTVADFNVGWLIGARRRLVDHRRRQGVEQRPSGWSRGKTRAVDPGTSTSTSSAPRPSERRAPLPGQATLRPRPPAGGRGRRAPWSAACTQPRALAGAPGNAAPGPTWREAVPVTRSTPLRGSRAPLAPAFEFADRLCGSWCRVSRPARPISRGGAHHHQAHRPSSLPASHALLRPRRRRGPSPDGRRAQVPGRPSSEARASWHSRLSWRTGNVFVADRHPGSERDRAVNICLPTAPPRSTASTPRPRAPGPRSSLAA